MALFYIFYILFITFSTIHAVGVLSEAISLIEDRVQCQLEEKLSVVVVVACAHLHGILVNQAVGFSSSCQSCLSWLVWHITQELI